jgi:hypothetical protein
MNATYILDTLKYISSRSRIVAFLSFWSIVRAFLDISLRLRHKRSLLETVRVLS